MTIPCCCSELLCEPSDNSLELHVTRATLRRIRTSVTLPVECPCCGGAIALKIVVDEQGRE